VAIHATLTVFASHQSAVRALSGERVVDQQKVIGPGVVDTVLAIST